MSRHKVIARRMFAWGDSVVRIGMLVLTALALLLHPLPDEHSGEDGVQAILQLALAHESGGDAVASAIDILGQLPASVGSGQVELPARHLAEVFDADFKILLGGSGGCHGGIVPLEARCVKPGRCPIQSCSIRGTESIHP